MNDVIEAEYGLPAPTGLMASVSTFYRRTTLVNVTDGERITLDQGLQVAEGDRRISFDSTQLIMETKCARRVGDISRLLWRYGIRPARVSKQSLAVATLFPNLLNNPWRAALKQMKPKYSHINRP